MRNLLAFIKTTIKGGIWFLFPFVVLVMVFGKAQKITEPMMAPLSQKIPVESFLGFGMVRVLTVVFLILACFLAGLFSKTKQAQSMVAWLETHFLAKLPGYEFFKTTGAQLLDMESGSQQPVVLARIEDAWQIGYITEVLDNGLFAVFIPGAPMPSSGSLYFMTEDRFERLSVTIRQAQQSLRRLGHGSKTFLAAHSQILVKSR